MKDISNFKVPCKHINMCLTECLTFITLSYFPFITKLKLYDTPLTLKLVS